ncbi:MAG: GDP-mannose 4,6-dehydratase, partial [Candidatus Omnitrophica bacterium]|nr:GDP-mannose 4,6-dehydratase [Candidatus Omnitrophota bacterium]
VRAYWLLVQKCKPGEFYNIGGSISMTVGDMLQKRLSMTDKKIVIKVDPALLRPSDVTLQIPDCSKFKKETGWEPEIPFEKTLKDLLDFWRHHYARR